MMTTLLSNAMYDKPTNRKTCEAYHAIADAMNEVTITLYMLRKVGTEKFFKTGSWWRDAQYATVWTSPSGPAGAKGRLKRVGFKGEVEVVKFEAKVPV
jgi:hypothetical protein